MKNKTLQINKDSIENELSNYKGKPYQAIFEYLWNSFDAGASRISINYDNPKSGFGYLKELVIEDNGTGWDLESKNTSNFLASDKSDETDRNKSLPRGRLGRGRYVFIWFCEKLTAISGQKKTEFEKDVDFRIEDLENIQEGTKLIFEGIKEELSNALKAEEVFINEILKEFGWFLYELPGRSIIINGKAVDVADIVSKQITYSANDFSTDVQIDIQDFPLECKIVLWKEKPNEYARFYFANKDKNKEILILTTRLNKKRDDFWHSVYIYSDLFDETDNSIDEQQQQLDPKQTKKVKKSILDELRHKLIELRKPLLISNSEKIIYEFRQERIIPKLEDYGVYDQKSYEELLKQVYIISPSVFVGRSKEEQAFMCSVFAGILSSADTNLIQMIIEQLNEMTEEDKKDLRQILHRSSLTNITRTIKEIDKRLGVLEDLETLLFINTKETLEVKHLQQVLNENVWIFGENYRLFSNTEGALKNTLKDYANKVLRVDPDEIKTEANGELDLFIIRELEESELIHRNIVVEIKRPSVKLKRKEYDQIEKYSSDILKEGMCNGDKMYWEFILVGNDYDDHIARKIENAKTWGEESKGLTENTRNGRTKIYVRKWSDIIKVEQGHKMKYLKEKLMIQSMVRIGESSDEIINRNKNEN